MHLRHRSWRSITRPMDRQLIRLPRNPWAGHHQYQNHSIRREVCHHLLTIWSSKLFLFQSQPRLRGDLRDSGSIFLTACESRKPKSGPVSGPSHRGGFLRSQSHGSQLLSTGHQLIQEVKLELPLVHLLPCIQGRRTPNRRRCGGFLFQSLPHSGRSSQSD